MKFFHHIICVTSALQHSSTLSARCIKRNPVAASACCSDFVSSCFIAGHHSIRFRVQQLSLPFCIVCSSCPEQDTSIVQIATWRSFPTLVIPRSEWRPPVKLPSRATLSNHADRTQLRKLQSPIGDCMGPGPTARAPAGGHIFVTSLECTICFKGAMC